MIINILTIFPEMFYPLNSSIIKRAQENGNIQINIINIRTFAENKHKSTDDYPFGGGAGMLMTPQPLFDSVNFIKSKSSNLPYCIYPSPQGTVFNNDTAKRLSKYDELIFICGHYEGIDQRVIEHCVDEEISIGDYILTGGELPVMVIVDALLRFVPGVLGSEQSPETDSFSDGLLEYPQYTRPADLNGMKVPDILLSGDHKKIAKWRREKQFENTYLKRPDLLTDKQWSKEDKIILDKVIEKNSKL